MEFKEFAQRPDAYAKLCLLIDPSIYDHSDVKKATAACLLFGNADVIILINIKFIQLLIGNVDVIILLFPASPCLLNPSSY
jgi:hypothetical protein